MGGTFPRARRLALVALVAAGGLSALSAGVSVRPMAARDVANLRLPDLDQELPTKVGAKAVSASA